MSELQVIYLMIGIGFSVGIIDKQKVEGASCLGVFFLTVIVTLFWPIIIGYTLGFKSIDRLG